MTPLLPRGEAEIPAFAPLEIAWLQSCVSQRISVHVSARGEARASFPAWCPDLILRSDGGLAGLLAGSVHLQ